MWSDGFPRARERQGVNKIPKQKLGYFIITRSLSDACEVLPYILTEVAYFTSNNSYTLLEEARKVPMVTTSGSTYVCGLRSIHSLREVPKMALRLRSTVKSVHFGLTTNNLAKVLMSANEYRQIIGIFKHRVINKFYQTMQFIRWFVRWIPACAGKTVGFTSPRKTSLVRSLTAY
jgi:hypothetical protein